MSIKRIKFYTLLGVLALLGSSVFGATHTVRKKETFYSISRKYGVSVEALMSSNGFSDPRKLYIGKKLVIPASKKSVKSTRKTARKVTTKPARRVATKSTRYSSRSGKFRVVVDAGHGGRDMGAYWYGVRESYLNLRVARKVESFLRQKGYPVTMTRRSDVFISLPKRAQVANRYRNAIFISIHFNATKSTRVSGAETYYKGRKSHYLAKCIQKQLIRNLKVRNRGVRRANFAVLKRTKCPAVLVECGFISNRYERKRCKTNSFQTLAARAIVSGIERYDRVF